MNETFESEKRDANRITWRMRANKKYDRSIAKQVKRRIISELRNTLDKMHNDAIY